MLAAGVLPPNPAELLEAPALDVMLRSLLQDGRKTLVIDSAPLLPVADAQILLNKPAVDASVVVARQGVTTRDHARRARLVLDGHAAAPIGLVVTGHTARDVYGYGYGEIWQPGRAAAAGGLPADAAARPHRAATGAGRRSTPRRRAGARRARGCPGCAGARSRHAAAACSTPRTAAATCGQRCSAARSRPAATSSSRRSPRRRDRRRPRLRRCARSP